MAAPDCSLAVPVATTAATTTPDTRQTGVKAANCRCGGHPLVNATGAALGADSPALEAAPVLSATPASFGIAEPDPTGYHCPECSSTHPARGASNKYFGALRCRWCQGWTRQMKRAFDAAWNRAMREEMAAADVADDDYPALFAARQAAQRVATAAAADARRAVLVAAVKACAEARAEMVVVA